MPTFKKKPETVDARQFTGGLQNGTDLVLWVQSNEGKILWVDEQQFSMSPARKGTSPEHIRLYDIPYGHAFDIVYVGDWILQRQNGAFEVIRQQDLDMDYEQV